MGNKLYGLVVPVGEIARVRRFGLHDKFWLGADNFNGAPVVGEYAIAEAGKMTHKPVEDLENHTGYAVKILLKEDLTTGMRDQGYLYLCEVVAL